MAVQVDQQAVKKLRRITTLRITFVLVLVLGAIQIVTYLVWAGEPMPTIMTAGPTRSDFICVTQTTWNSLSQAQQHYVDERLQRSFKKVYHSETEIPESNKLYSDHGGEKVLIGLQGGIKSWWTLKSRGLFWYRCEFGYYSGNLAAGGMDVLFVWVAGRWVRVWTFFSWVS